MTGKDGKNKRKKGGEWPVDRIHAPLFDLVMLT